MELVYLWVEDYKNIHEQGFNFSPRFTCQYDKETQELTIDENREYVSIFPENISVTAIVGENGSGKTHLVISLINYLYQKINYFMTKKFIIIVSKETKLYLISNFKIFEEHICTHILIPTNQSDTKHLDTTLIQTFLDEIHTSLYDFSLSLNTFNNTNNIELYYPNKNLNLKLIEQIDVENIIYYIHDNNHKNHYGNYFDPTTILLKVNQFEKNPAGIYIKEKFIHINTLQNDLTENIDRFLFIIYEYISYLIINISINFNFQELEKVENMEGFLTVLEEKTTTIENEKHKSFDFDKKMNTKFTIDKIQNTLNYAKRIKDSRIMLENLIIFNKDRIAISSFGIEFLIDIKYFKTTNNALYIFEELPECFNIDFVDNNQIKYENLSNGEKSALRIRFYIERIINKNKNKDYLFILDEPNNEFHPLWQKKFLSYLIDAFKHRNEKIHLIITSHSPFILSDLPKENVIFLEKGEQVYPNIETFGANIHTLLSHGFFMKDGLMGEFAKEKIDKALTLLNKPGRLSKTSLSYCENIISIIGEPIIKKQLQRMLDSKRLSKIDEIDRLKSDMAEIHKKIKRLEGRK